MCGCVGCCCEGIDQVIGPPDTPYSGGFFFFDMAFPDESTGFTCEKTASGKIELLL